VNAGDPFLDSIGERAAVALGLDEVTRRWPPGSILFHEGDRADRVFVVRAGRVKLVVTEANGTETVLAVRSPGDLVGEQAAVDGRPRSASAIALDEVTCSVVPAERFHSVLEQDPAAAMALVRLLSERLREAEHRRAEHGALDAVQRLSRRLLELAGEGDTVAGLNQDDLAALIGASRESVAKALQSLRSAGLVKTGRRTIEVLDHDGLRRRSGL
jgi:CRP/FNR family cyclic AMP-dependent transcriptional regulator